MKRLSRLLLAAVLLVAAGAIPHVSNAASSVVPGTEVAGPVKPEPIASTCGYSLGDEENAQSDAEGNAHRYCQAMGCKGAIITTVHPAWTDKQGYTHVCVTFACDCSVVVVAAK
ncbi:MAG TPA: hypothetical protein VEL74_12390 [Thermoanaerobaculia bacterium]|nr:hypothetical protein [Thermoanaerobaculia bacterium]